MPMRTPAARPSMGPGDGIQEDRVEIAKVTISTSSTARTRWRVAERILVAQVTPIQAPTRLPASRLTTTNQ